MSLVVKSVLCDDIRREDNGKLLIIGAYDKNFVVGKLPSQFPLSVWLSVDGLEKGSHTFKMSLNINGEPIIETDGTIDINDVLGGASMFFVGFPVHIEEYGEMTGTISIGDGEDISFLSMPILEPPTQ